MLVRIKFLLWTRDIWKLKKKKHVESNLDLVTDINFNRIVRIKVLQKLCFLIETQSSATSSISSLFCRRIDLDVGDDHFLARTSRVPSVNFKLKKIETLFKLLQHCFIRGIDIGQTLSYFLLFKPLVTAFYGRDNIYHPIFRITRKYTILQLI